MQATNVFSVNSQTLPSRQLPTGCCTKIQRLFDFVYECVIKEFGSGLRHVFYRSVFWINPHKYGLNPTTINQAIKTNQTAKVVLLLHGVGGHPSCFIPMAKKLAESNLTAMYTVSLNPTDENPIPIESLTHRVNALAINYLNSGYADVEFALVGHSLGALVSAKYVWRGPDLPTRSLISTIISLAGRLKYVHNTFFWFCEDVKPEIERTYECILKSPDKATLYTIRGDCDAIVPRQSVHIQDKPNRECTVHGWGHSGIVFAPETHKQVRIWIQRWVEK